MTKTMEFAFLSFCFVKCSFQMAFNQQQCVNCTGCSGPYGSHFDEWVGHKLHFTMLSEQPNEANHCACCRNITSDIIHSTTRHD